MNLNASAEFYLNLACEKLPVVKHAIENYGDKTLSEYLSRLTPKTNPTYQPLDDLLEVMGDYISPLLGESLAGRVVKDIEAFPVVLTSNHHGVVYFAQDIQGSLIFSFNQTNGNAPRSTVPMFSCGGVPLDNLTYPLGLLFYKVANGHFDSMPKKLPVFSNKRRRQLVSVSGPFDKKMVERAQGRIDKMIGDGAISSSLAEPTRRILQEDYAASSMMELVNYSQQAVVLNNRIWKRLFKNADSVPDVICLELEKIAGGLLEKDLKNPKSLAWLIMFDPSLRENVLEELDGKRACWEREKLEKRLHFEALDEKQKAETNGGGTMLFWGVNGRGRRVPLYLDTESQDDQRLRGIDDRGNAWDLPYSPESVIEGLRQGKLLPSLLASFLVVSLARGVICAGGYYQAEYLPAMQQGIATALRRTNGYQDLAHSICGVDTDVYLSGMLSVMTMIEEGYFVPAGPLEIMAAGGLTKSDLEKMLDLTVRDAHVAALFDTVPDILSFNDTQENWKRQLAKDCCRLLKDRIVLK